MGGEGISCLELLGMKQDLSISCQFSTSHLGLWDRSWPQVCPDFWFVKVGLDEGLFKPELAWSLGQGHRPSCDTACCDDTDWALGGLAQK